MVIIARGCMQQRVQSSSSAQMQQRQKLLSRRYKSVKMLFVSYIWYSVCILPAPIASLSFAAAYQSSPILQLLLRALLLLGYATMPVRIHWLFCSNWFLQIVCIAMNTDYRRRFQTLIYRLFRVTRIDARTDRSIINGPTATATNLRPICD